MGSSRYGPRDGPAARRCSCRYISGVQAGWAPGTAAVMDEKERGKWRGSTISEKKKKTLVKQSRDIIITRTMIRKGAKRATICCSCPSLYTLEWDRAMKEENFLFCKKKKITWCPPNTKKTRPTPFIIILRDTQDVKES